MHATTSDADGIRARGVIADRPDRPARTDPAATADPVIVTAPPTHASGAGRPQSAAELAGPAEED